MPHLPENELCYVTAASAHCCQLVWPWNRIWKESCSTFPVGLSESCLNKRSLETQVICIFCSRKGGPVEGVKSWHFVQSTCEESSSLQLGELALREPNGWGTLAKGRKVPNWKPILPVISPIAFIVLGYGGSGGGVGWGERCSPREKFSERASGAKYHQWQGAL